MLQIFLQLNKEEKEMLINKNEEQRKDIYNVLRINVSEGQTKVWKILALTAVSVTSAK